MTGPTITLRNPPPRAVWALEQAGVPPLLARLFAGRGVRAIEELDDTLARLLPPAGLLGIQAAARLLADAIAAAQRGAPVALTLCGERSAQRFENLPRSLWQRLASRWQAPLPHTVLETI